MLSRRADYGVRAMVDLASQSSQRRLVVAEIAERQGIPVHFLAKIMPRLARAGLVRTTLGAGGGVTLAIPADQISLLQIIQAIEGPLRLNVCSLDPQQCADHRDCAALEVWCRAQAQLNETLAQTRLADLVARQRRAQSKNQSGRFVDQAGPNPANKE